MTDATLRATRARTTRRPSVARRTAPAAIALEGVAKAYGEVHALDGVSLRLEGGSVVALVGPNGAGKSTLLAVIAGLVRPDAGSATIGGPPVDGHSGAAAFVGLLTHRTMLYDQLTGRENLELHARLRAASADGVDAVLEKVGLGTVADRPAGTYSHGMRKRLALARTLLNGPRVVLLDEPFAGLEPQSRERLATVIEHLRGTTTVVFATHDLERASRHADRIVALDEGRVVGAAGLGQLRPVADDPHPRDGGAERRARAGLLRTAWTVLRKDVLVEWRARAVSSAVLVLAALLATILAMAFEPLAGSPRAVSGILWVLIVFTTIHGLVRSFDDDFRDDALTGLLLSGADPGGVYLGRVASAAAFLLAVGAAATVTVAVLFATPSLVAVMPSLGAVVGVAVVGLAAVGGVLTVVSRHTPLGETLLPLLLLPLAVPVLLGGIESVAILLETGALDRGWLRVLVLYALGMLAAGTVVFEHAMGD